MAMDRFCDVIYGHEFPIRAIAYMPDGRHLLSGDDQGKVKIWDMMQQRLVEEYKNHMSAIRCIVVSGELWASISRDGTACIYNNKGEKEVFRFGNNNCNILFTPDNKNLVVPYSTDRVMIWDIAKKTHSIACQRHREYEIYALAISPNGRFIASGGNDYVVRIWDLHEGKELPPLEFHKSVIKSLAFSPDSLTLASADSGGCHNYWDMTKKGVESLKLTFSWSGHEIMQIAFSPTMSIFASAGADARIKLFDIDNENKRLEDMIGHQKTVNCIAFSPDGKYLASGANDNTIRIWNIKSPHLVA